MRRAIATRDALSPIGGDSKSRFKPLYQSQISSQWTTKTTPNSIAHQWVKSSSNDPSKSRAYRKSVHGMQLIRHLPQKTEGSKIVDKRKCGHDYRQG
jgi:hypothetical protein